MFDAMWCHWSQYYRSWKKILSFRILQEILCIVFEAVVSYYLPNWQGSVRNEQNWNTGFSAFSKDWAYTEIVKWEFLNNSYHIKKIEIWAAQLLRHWIYISNRILVLNMFHFREMGFYLFTILVFGIKSGKGHHTAPIGIKGFCLKIVNILI